MEINQAPPDHGTPDILVRALRWRTIWPQVIAHAWANPVFKANLECNAAKAIKKEFDYDLSPEPMLTIKDAPEGTPNYNPDAKLGEDRWAGLPPMELTMFIPPVPELPHQAIALTHYSETGRTYPMTTA